MKRNLKFIVPLLVCIFLASCSDDDDNNGIVDNAETPIEFNRINEFDPMSPENPQGVASLSGGNILVSFPALKELRIYNPENGTLVNTISDVPSFSFMNTTNDGNIVLASAAFLDPAFDPTDPSNPNNQQPIANHGIWIFNTSTESLTQLAQMTPDTFPTHITQLPNDDYLVSNIFGQNIFRVEASGAISEWASDTVLAGDPDPNRPGPEGRPPFPVGIEGIRISGQHIIGVVADWGRIVRIPINNDGSAGNVEVLFENRNELLGLAHFVFDSNGDLIAGSGFQSKIWKIDLSTDFTVTELANNDSDVVVDTPGMLNYGAGSNQGDIYFTNNSFVRNDDKNAPNPGLTKITGALD